MRDGDEPDSVRRSPMADAGDFRRVPKHWAYVTDKKVRNVALLV